MELGLDADSPDEIMAAELKDPTADLFGSQVLNLG